MAEPLMPPKPPQTLFEAMMMLPEDRALALRKTVQRFAQILRRRMLDRGHTNTTFNKAHRRLRAMLQQGAARLIEIKDEKGEPHVRLDYWRDGHFQVPDEKIARFVYPLKKKIQVATQMPKEKPDAHPNPT